MANGWKITAIILIIVLILENAFIFYGMIVVNETDRKTFQCSNDICPTINATSFLYDEFNYYCYCYKENQIIYKKYLG